MAGKVILKTGDAFQTESPILLHSVNTQGKFASGFAFQVAQHFPNVRQAYLEHYNTFGWEVGDIQVVEVNHPTIKMTINLAGQRYYGRTPGVCYVSYPGIRLGLVRALNYAEDLNMNIAMPKIGCGLGGGDWNKILAIISDAVRDRTVSVEVWTP